MRALITLCFSVSLAISGGFGGPNAAAGDGDAGEGGPDASLPRAADAAPPPPLEASVYAHSATELYRVDPDTLEVSLVGPFLWPGLSDQMTDIALDRAGNMTGVSFTRVYRIDKDTGDCVFLANLGRSFNGLSYVPASSTDPSAPEILVAAANDGTLYELDPDTGVTTYLGALGGGWRSSGDLVSVRGLGTVATVKQNGTDRLARIDPTTWEATILGDTGVMNIWGLGFWGDKVYGFTDNRQFVLLDIATGAATPVSTSDVRWWGAGVTTSAPVVN
jgi:hypothetical protein